LAQINKSITVGAIHESPAKRRVNFMKKTISILLAVVLLATVFAGCSKSNKAEVTAENMQNVQAMVDYAEQLEAEGNTDAAAAVWALIPGAAEKEAAQAAQNAIEDNSQAQAYGAMSEAQDLASAMNDKEE